MVANLKGLMLGSYITEDSRDTGTIYDDSILMIKANKSCSEYLCYADGNFLEVAYSCNNNVVVNDRELYEYDSLYYTKVPLSLELVEKTNKGYVIGFVFLDTSFALDLSSTLRIRSVIVPYKHPLISDTFSRVTRCFTDVSDVYYLTEYVSYTDFLKYRKTDAVILDTSDMSVEIFTSDDIDKLRASGFIIAPLSQLGYFIIGNLVYKLVEDNHYRFSIGSNILDIKCVEDDLYINGKMFLSVLMSNCFAQIMGVLPFDDMFILLISCSCYKSNIISDYITTPLVLFVDKDNLDLTYFLIGEDENFSLDDAFKAVHNKSRLLLG